MSWHWTDKGNGLICPLNQKNNDNKLCLFLLFLFLIKFIEVTLINRII